MALSQIIYSSQATVPFADEQLRSLLRQARRANHAQRITGLLLYANEQFVQVLEGEPEAVHALYHERIAHDPRHRELLLLDEGIIPHRTFPDWSMGFVPASPSQVARLNGFFNPDRTRALSFRSSAANPELMELLREFAAGSDPYYDDEPSEA